MATIFQAVEDSDVHSISHEALVMAETQFMTDDYPKEVDETAMMYFKDDDGMWCMLHDKYGQHYKKFESYEELADYWKLEY